MKIYTATPMPFFEKGESEDRFFSRDTGLLCRQFQREGHESRVVMLDGPNVQPHPDILRVSLEEMESVEFWAKLKLDAVVLYAWMLPRYLKIAQAIKASGTKLISRCDSIGLYDPRIDTGEYLRQEFYGYGSTVLIKNNLQRTARTILKTGLRLINRNFQKGVVAFSDCCDSILIESSLAQDRMQRFLQLYKRPDLAERVQFIPHVIVVHEDEIISCEKEKLIIAVGRWDDYIKNGPLLIRVLVKALKKHPDYRAVIVGSGNEKLKKKAEKSEMSGCIEFTGRIAHSDVQQWMAKAQIMLVTSRYESFNMAAAEALCQGVSVVGSMHLPSMQDFVHPNSGTMARSYRDKSFDSALSSEIYTWTFGLRKRDDISFSLQVNTSINDFV